MRAAGLGLLVCVIACGAAPHRASRATPGSSPLPVATSLATPIALASPASAARTSGTSLPLDTVNFSCRLPVNEVNGSAVRPSEFLALPGRVLTDAGANGDYYDRVVGRWLPVGPVEVAPDGRRYAEIDLGVEGTATVARVPTRVRVVDAATDATLRVVAMAGTIDYGILDFAATGVEVSMFSSQGIGARLPGVWNVNPDTGVVTKISDTYDPPTARWIVDSSGSQIIHRDAAGHTTTWLNMPGYSLGFIPFAGDSAILVEATWYHADQNPSFGADLLLVRGPGAAVKILSNVFPPVYGPGGNVPGSPYWYMVQAVGSSTGPRRYYSDNIFDEHGIWLTDATSADSAIGFVGDLFLVTPAGAILHVDNRPLFAAGSCG